jgi:DNA-directed RNA polymerase subunit RPC12/RpoP
MPSGQFQPTPKNKFKCPLCGSTAYDHVYSRRTDGSIRQTRIYKCGGCSVLFEDPDKFTKQEQVEGIARHGVPPRAKGEA